MNPRSASRSSSRICDARCSRLASVGSSRDRTTALPAAADAPRARNLPSAAATRSSAVLSEVLRLRTRASTSFSSRSTETMLLRIRKASPSRRLATTVASSFFTSSSAWAIDSLDALRYASARRSW